MKPLEICILPDDSDMIDLYVNGLEIELDNNAFISEKKLFLPVKELVDMLSIENYYDNENIIIEDGADRYSVSSAAVTNISTGKIFEYLTRQIEDVIFVDAFFFLKELDVTEAWEEETQTLYLATVLHYDGYRIVPTSIYDENEDNEEYDYMFLFVDASIIDVSGNDVIVKSEDGFLHLEKGMKKDFIYQKGDTLRFCFTFQVDGYTDGIPSGFIWEVVKPDNRFRIGNMIYTAESWDSFNESDMQEDISYGLDKHVLIGMFNQYPNILADRKKLHGFLKDAFPEKRLYTNLFMVAYDIGIASEINSNQLDDLFVHRMIKILVEENGINADYAIDIVCLWCDVYGSHILGKSFISKKKYNSVIQGALTQRESQWINPILNAKKEIHNLSYYEPQGWDSREAEFPYVGTYFYPYSLRELGMVWVTAIGNPQGVKGDKFVYNGLIAGLCQGNLKNMSVSVDIKCSGFYGKKVNYNMMVSENVMEVDVYLIPTEKYIYQIFFGEQLGLTANMLLFEKEFMDAVDIIK